MILTLKNRCKTRIAVVGALTLALLIISSGCGTTSTGERVAAARSNVLSHDEIKSINARNMYEVVQQLRPRWLIVRGGIRSFQEETSILIYQGNARLGTVEVLRQIPPDMVLSAEYVDGMKAMSTLPGIGTGHVAGAIVLTPVTKHN